MHMWRLVYLWLWNGKRSRTASTTTTSFSHLSDHYWITARRLKNWGLRADFVAVAAVVPICYKRIFPMHHFITSPTTVESPIIIDS
jgi:hypothetical protein